mmetsp:Transcript_14237/g.32756  ORF Transcript_14237/g.32756 Transcript_14237/m.32756 type:complete len:89 (-) Transcript_14237:810-1076(-)
MDGSYPRLLLAAYLHAFNIYRTKHVWSLLARFRWMDGWMDGSVCASECVCVSFRFFFYTPEEKTLFPNHRSITETKYPFSRRTPMNSW